MHKRTVSLTRINLKLGLKAVANPKHLDELRFWGRIRGLKSNYYIAVATRFQGEYESPSKAFFYATENFEFKRLPFLKWELKEAIQEVADFDFHGTPDKVIWKEGKGAENPEEDEEEKEQEVSEEKDVTEGRIDLMGEEEEEVKRRPIKITELNRLSFVVRAIENDCALVPVGSVKIMPNHQLRYVTKILIIVELKYFFQKFLYSKIYFYRISNFLNFEVLIIL